MGSSSKEVEEEGEADGMAMAAGCAPAHSEFGP
jgi:hypothetical protein